MKEYIAVERQTDNGGYVETVSELIRCKDCRHSETDRNGIPYCTKFWRFMEYCSSRERKEE